MGETYRGLTIRFGGDTSSLQKALRGANAEISSTQSELRKIESALKFDASDVIALSTKMELLKERSVGVHEKMERLARAMEQFGHSASDTKALVASFENIDKKLAETTARYEALVSATKKTKNEINSLSDVGDVFDRFGNAISGQLAKFESMGVECAKLAQKYRALSSEVKECGAELKNTEGTQKQQAQIQKLAAEFVKTQSQARQLREEFESLQGASLFDNANADRFNQRMRELDKTIESVEDDARRMREALEIDPFSIETARKYITATRDSIEALSDKARELQTRISALNASGIDNIGMSAKDVREDFVKCSNELSEWHSRIGRAEADLSSMKTELTEMVVAGKKGTAEYAQMEEAVRQAESSIREMRSAMEAAQHAFDTSQARTELNRLETELAETRAEAKRLDDAFEEMRTSGSINASTFTTLGMALSANLTPALSMAVSYSVDAAKEIDSAYRDMRKTVNGTEEDFEHLRDAAMDFASTSVTSADQILEIEAMGGQMGLAADELDRFAETVANLNIATNIDDASEMAQIMGQLSNILDDLSVETFPNFGDALVRLGNNNAALESDILDVSSRIGSMGSIVGMTTPQILAWSTAIASTGQNSEAAGTAISNTMSDIETAVSSGGDKLEAFTTVAGSSAEDFAKAWKSSPSEAMQMFVEGLREIDESGGSVDATLQELGITGVRQKQALEGLSQTIGTLDDALTMSEDAWNGVSDQWGEAGDAATEAARKSEGFSGQLAILANNANMIGSEFAESLAPVLEKTNAVMSDAYGIVEEMPDPIKRVMLAITALAVAVGPALTVIGPLKTAFGSISSGASSAAKTMEKAGTSVSTLGKAASAGKTAFAGLGAAIAAVLITQLVESIADTVKQMNDMRTATDGLTSAVSSMSAEYSGSSANIIAASSAQTAFTQTAMTAAEAAEKQADIVRSMNETWADVKASTSLVSDYSATILELAGNCDGSAEKLAALEFAVRGYNDATGSSVEITDDATGALNTTSDAISANTQQWIENAEAQAKQEMYKDLYKQRAANLDSLAAAQAKYNAVAAEDMTGQNAEIVADWTARMTQAQEEVEELTALVNADNTAMEKLAGTQNEASEASADMATAISEAAGIVGKSEEDFKSWAENLGICTEQGMQRISAAIIAGTPAAYAAMQELTGVTQTDFDAMCTDLGVSSEAGMLAFQAAVQNGTPPAVALVAALTDMTDDDMQAASDFMGLKGVEGMAKFQSAIQSGTPPAVALVQALTDMTDADMKAAAAYMGYSGDSGIQQFASAVLAREPDALAAANSVAFGSVGMLESHEGEAGTSGSTTGANYADGIGGEESNARSQAESVASSAESGIGTADGSSAGWNLGSSFASGIESARGYVMSVASSIASAASAAINAALEINSPSKVAMTAARRFAKEGFADTIASYEPDAYAASYAVGESAAGALSDGYGKNASETVTTVEEGLLAMRDAAQDALNATLNATIKTQHMEASGSVTNNTNNSRDYTITMNVTADSGTTLESLVRQAERAGMAYGRR